MAEETSSKQVKIRISTYDRLTAKGKKNETYDSVINRMIDSDDELQASKMSKILVAEQVNRGKGKGRKGKGE
jgi:hypothetical protein